MADQISIRLDETNVAAGSAVTATVNFRTRATASASTPSSIRYRVDCLTTSRALVEWTSVAAASSASILIPGTSNAIVDEDDETEKRQITVEIDTGLSTQARQATTWIVRNIRSFPLFHDFPDSLLLEPYYPLDDLETLADIEHFQYPPGHRFRYLDSFDVLDAHFYRQTAAELAAGITPTAYQYVPGDVRRYGADPTGVSDSTTAINNALSINAPVYFYAGTYLASNLVQTISFQRLVAFGEVRITKNANGVLFTSSGANVECNGIEFRGDAASPTYTGDNINASGDHFRLINCGSRWTSGKAVLATGNHVQILGTCDIYQTTASGASDYDIVIGVSGTATLYHDIRGIYTSQSTGGIQLIDTGSTKIVSSQFGKLFVDAGTSPGGTNGGIYVGNRILGNVTVEVPSAVFAGNQFSAIAIVFAATANGCRMDASNTYENGHTVTNNGNANNLIVRQVSSGSKIHLQFGDDSSSAIIEITPDGSGDFEFNKGVTLKNNQTFTLEGTVVGTDFVFSMSSANNVGITNEASAKGIIFTQAGAGTINMDINGARSMQIDANNTAGNTRFLIYDVDNATLERVTVGAADSGGAGFKVLRIPN